MKKWLLILTLLCSSASYAQQNGLVFSLQQQLNEYVAMAQAKLDSYEQEAVDMYNNAKAYVLQKIQIVTGHQF